MSVDENKGLARRFYEDVINRRNVALAEQIMSEQFVERGASPDQAGGLDGFKQFLKMIAGAFPDIQVDVEDMIAERAKVAVRLTVRGTHEGVLMGRIQPTGKRAVWTGIDILEIDEGKIVARWSERNLLGLLEQLGVIS